MAEELLVIGAGPAGIACAYALEQAGLSYKVVDKAQEIASTWNSLYPSLRLNTTRFFSHMPDKKIPLRYGIFPSGKQYHRYLADYVKQHNFNIHLGVSVYKAFPENDGWRVESSEGSAWYPAIISATGRFNAPTMPHIPGMDDFQGQIIHAQDYLSPEPFKGKQVMVVGNGPSGVDIVTELGNYAVRPALLAQRTGVVLKRRYPLGLPKHVWMMIGERLPARFNKLLNKVTTLGYPNLDKLGIKTPPPDMASSAAGGTRGAAFIRAVKAGKVKCVDGPVRFYPQEVELQDGSRIQPEVVIMATGYKPVIDQYIDLKEARPNDQGWPRRVDEPDGVYWQGKREVEGYPGLYLVGVYYQGKGTLYNNNIEAVQAVEEIKERLAKLKNHPGSKELEL